MNLATRVLETLAGELFSRSTVSHENEDHEIGRWVEFSGLVAGAVAKTLAKHDAELEGDDPDHP